MNTSEIFDTLLEILVNRLDVGYAIGLGFQAIADKGTPLAHPYWVSDNFVRIHLKQELKKREVVISDKMISLFLKTIRDSTEAKYRSGERESFKTYLIKKNELKL